MPGAAAHIHVLLAQLLPILSTGGNGSIAAVCQVRINPAAWLIRSAGTAWSGRAPPVCASGNAGIPVGCADRLYGGWSGQCNSGRAARSRHLAL